MNSHPASTQATAPNFLSRARTFLRALLRGEIDARTHSGKVALLACALLLSHLFNWESGVSAAVIDLAGLAGPDRGFPHVAAISAKIAHPFSPLDHSQDPTGHFEKLAFRFVPYALAHALHWDHYALFRLQIVLGLIFPLLVWRLLFNATGSLSAATAGVLLINALYAGFAFCYDFLFFDAFAYFFLVAAMGCGSRWLSILLMLAAGFTDERAVLAAGFVPLWRLLTSPDASRRDAWNELCWFVAFLLSYLVLRVGIGAATGLTMGRQGLGWGILRLNLPHLPLLAWSVFAGGWIILAAAASRVWSSRDRKRGFLLLAGFACSGGIFLAGLLVGDSIRSQQYAFPLLLLSLAMLSHPPRQATPRLVLLAVALSLVTPITIYLGMETHGTKVIYNITHLKPGYLTLFGF